MGLREVLRNWQTPQLDVPPYDFSPLEQAAQKVAEMAGGSAPIPPPKNQNLEAVAAAIRAHMVKGERLCSFPSRRLRDAAWVMFRAEGTTNQALADVPTFRIQYTKWLAGQKLTSYLKTVLHTFLADYPQKLDSFQDWRSFLDDQLRSIQKPSLRLWQEKNQRFGFFKTDGVSFAADEIWSNWEDWGMAFETAGLSSLLAKSEFAQSVFLALLKRSEIDSLTKRDVTTSQRIIRLLKFAVSPDNNQYSLRYPGLGTNLINSLLLPYANGRGSQVIVKDIKSFLLKHFRDPRIEPLNWASADPQALDQMKRWLAKDSLLLFLEILSATADPMWAFRKVFWEKYLAMGVIDEAWPVLGSQARLKAARANTKAPYGKLNQAMGEQSVLLLRIDNLIIAEWSHSGACRIWTRETEGSRANSPTLYGQDYIGPVLRTECEEWIRHAGSENYVWQTNLADIIHKYTGIKINVRS